MSEVIITVRGEHETTLAPEEAVARVSVRAEGADRGEVVERMAGLAAALREDLAARKDAGALADWSSQRVSVWSERPWTGDGKRLAPVHHASVEVTATFTDFAALSWWLGDVSEREGVQIDGVQWRLTRETARRVEAEVAAEAVQVAVARAAAYAHAIGREVVTAREIADLGLLSRDGAQSAPELARAAFAMDAAGSAPGLQFQPEDLTVSAAVEARFAAS